MRQHYLIERDLESL